jgi:hypothetical protein
MTDDTSYDIMQRGGKIRILSNEQFYENRELVQRMTPEAIRQAKQQLDDMKRRVSDLQREREGPVISDPPETLCKIDKVQGKISGARDMQ